MQFVKTAHPHRRYNPLNGQWVLVCPHRMLRPWLGQQEQPQSAMFPEFDPKNPLCPGVKRCNGTKNPNYKNTFVFTNDFPALVEDIPEPLLNEDPFFKLTSAKGTCRVMCFHPKSNLTIPLMKLEDIEIVIKEWINQFNELSIKYNWVQIFENKGSAMGCSNLHPHCQIWACSFLPTEPTIKDKFLSIYYKEHRSQMLHDYLEREILLKDRIISLNNDWVVLVPFWAAWPFETMLINRNNKKRINELSEREITSVAVIIKELTTKYDNLFLCSFPYSMGWHGAPSNGPADHWTLHAIYYPPLLRSSSIKKFMVGFELLCENQRDMTPEQAAHRLNQQSGQKHYLH